MNGAAKPGERAGAQWERLARRAARRSEARVEAFDRQQLLCFSIDGACYAVRVERVRQIVRVRPIAPVPRVPREVRGVISLRGIAGATELGDESPVLVLDVSALLADAMARKEAA